MKLEKIAGSTDFVGKSGVYSFELASNFGHADFEMHVT